MSDQIEVPTVREASQGGLRDRPDRDLPMIAAHWLTQGLDSPELREMAALGRADQVEARRLLPAVMRSLNVPLVERDSPWEDDPWRGCWYQIVWARCEIGYKLSALAAAQHVLEVVGDVPALWDAGRGADLQNLIQDWDARPDQRPAIEKSILDVLTSLNEQDVPPLIGNDL